jgi:hypothetical protein
MGRQSDHPSGPAVDAGGENMTVLRTYRFSLPEGVVYLELPYPLSQASSDELFQWLSIIERQVQRAIPLTPNEATE